MKEMEKVDVRWRSLMQGYAQRQRLLLLVVVSLLSSLSITIILIIIIFIKFITNIVVSIITVIMMPAAPAATIIQIIMISIKSHTPQYTQNFTLQNAINHFDVCYKIYNIHGIRNIHCVYISYRRTVQYRNISAIQCFMVFRLNLSAFSLRIFLVNVCYVCYRKVSTSIRIQLIEERNRNKMIEM